MNKLLLTFIVGIFMISFASALDFDNTVTYIEEPQPYGTFEVTNAFGLGSILAVAQLPENGCDSSGRYCSAYINISLLEEGQLIEDRRFYKILDDGTFEQGNVRWSKLEYYTGSTPFEVTDYETVCNEYIVPGNGSIAQNCSQFAIGTHTEYTPEWKEFTEEEMFATGDYQVKLSGEKRPEWTYDWQVKIKGKWTTVWAVWGSGTVGTLYQEVANSYGGNLGNSWNDSNYETLSKAGVGQSLDGYANYTKVNPNMNGSVLWRVKDLNGEVNLTVPNSCINYYPNTIAFKVNSNRIVTERTQWNCYNGDWINLRNSTFEEVYEEGVYFNFTGGVILNSPSNNTGQFTSLITTNASANIIGGSYLVNATLWDDSTGTWGARNSTIFYIAPASTNPTSLSMSSGGSRTEADGAKFIPKYNITEGFIVIKHGSVTATTATLKNEGGSTLATSTFSGNNASFSYSLIAGTKYTIVINSGGSAYTQYYSTSLGAISFNISKTTLNWTNGVLNGVIEWDRIYNVIDIYTAGNAPASSTQTFTNTYTSGNTIKWNYQFCDSDGACGFAPNNYTFFVDNIAPSITLNYPTSLINYGAVNSTLQLNVTASDTNLGSVWYNYNGTNVTIAGATSGVANLSNITLSTKKNITIYANDTVGNLNTTTFSWDYLVWENSRTHNDSTYETSYETYSINLTANSSLTSVYLNYNGTEYQTLNTINGIWSYSRDIPTTMNGNNSISFRFVYGGNNISSSYTSYQYVNPIVLTICNATYSTKYINFTFKDENTLNNINATMQTANWIYYMGQGTQTKSYAYTTVGSSSNYTFCFSPTDKTVYAEPSITYLYTDYPARFYTPGILTLTNSTTGVILYLLSQTDGIYVTFSTVSTSSTAIPGALITIVRTILGSTVTIADGTTDSAGSYTVWLNPNYDHTVTASKTGYGSNTQTIKPTQSAYTLILSSGTNYTYVSNFQGLLWSYFPRQRLTANATNFGFNVTSTLNNIIKCKIDLLTNNKSSILATAEQVTSNASLCSVSVTYTPTITNPKIKGRLLVDIGAGYQILEEDAYWFFLDYNTTGMTLTDWFSGFNSTNIDLRYFNNNDQHREYTYILLFFLVVTIICAVLNSAGWDIQTGGGMIFLVAAFVWIASVPGFLTLSNIAPYPIIDKYFIAIIYSMFCIGFASRSIA